MNTILYNFFFGKRFSNRLWDFLIPKPVIFFGGGGGQNTTSQVYQRNIPPELKPYYELLLDTSMKQLFVSGDNPQRGKPLDLTNFQQYKPRNFIENPYVPGVTQATDYSNLKRLASGGEVKHFDGGGAVASDITGIQQTNPSGVPGVAGLTPGHQLGTSLAGATTTSPAFGTATDTAQTNALGQQALAAQAASVNPTIADLSATGADTANKAANTISQSASNIGNYALNAGDLANKAGNLAADVGLTGGSKYGEQGSQAGKLAGDIGVLGGSKYGEQGSQAGALAADVGLTGGYKYGDQGNEYGKSAITLSPTASGYGTTAEGYGSKATLLSPTAQGYGTTAAGIGNTYETKATSSDTVNKYMNPYINQALDPSLKLLQQQADIEKAKAASAAAQKGAYGGSRQSVENALIQQGYDLSKAKTIADAYNTAYNTAQQNILEGQKLNLQGQQTGIDAVQAQNQLYNTGIAGAQTGLNAVNTQNQLYNTGIAGAQTGLTGVGRAIEGLNTNISGAQTGLTGVGRAIEGLNTNISGAQTGLTGVGKGLEGLNLTQQGVSNAVNAANVANAANQGTLSAADLSLRGNAQQQAAIQNQVANAATAANILGGSTASTGAAATAQTQRQNNIDAIINNLVSTGNIDQATTQKIYDYANGLSEKYNINGTAALEALGFINSILAGLSTNTGTAKVITTTGNANNAKGGIIKMADGGGIGDLAVYNALNGVM